MQRQPFHPHFTLSSNDLLDMLEAAERKFEHAREQSALREEARSLRRLERTMRTEAEQRRRRALFAY